ncbi:MAG: TRAP transporter substrate-binding protein [Oscillospiraceae bacterium]|nr:TRAP transporter substrate-binding protein [Oscillospiraceae bacterium]
MKKLLSILLILCFLLLGGCGGEEATVPEYVLTYAENQPDHYPTTLGARKFAELVKERTDGKVVIQVKYGGEYGTEEEVLEQMAFGGIDFARISLASISDELPALNVLQLPYLYEDSAHMWRILDGQIGQDFLGIFEEAGLVGLSWYDAGARSYYSDSVKITCPADMAGLTVRVQESQMVLDMITLLGGQPVTFAYSDVYYAFETGKIDAAENNWPSYQMQEHYKVAKYYTVDEHSRVPEVQLASARTWEILPEEYREIIADCARESALYQREIWTAQEEESRAAAIAGGCQEIVLTEEALAQFRETAQPLYETYCGEYLDLVRQIQEG